MAIPKGPEIERLRVNAGMKRPQLAKLVNLDYRTIYGIERGHTFAKRTTYSRESLVRIANVLKVGLYDVMEREAQGDKAAANTPDTATQADEATDQVSAA